MKINNLYRHKWTKKRMIWCIIISCRAQNFVRNKRSVWIEFIDAKIENWKYCNKIIFKYVNSTMRLIFNIFKCMNSAATVVNNDFCLCTVNSCDFIVHALKKKKSWNWNAQNAQSKWVQSLGLDLAVAFAFTFFFFSTHAYRRTNGYCLWTVAVYSWLFSPFYQSCRSHKQYIGPTNFTFQQLFY